MKADFSGWVTKANLLCTDGRTIMPDAFKHQDSIQVPLVWQHGHTDPENVLGHVKLENRDEGVYGYGYFNSTKKAEHTRIALEHGDFNAMSIWANNLVEKSKRVLHGAIREVSLVLAGANPGAIIENITIRHSDMDEVVLDDEAIIYTGLTLEHSADSADSKNKPLSDNTSDSDEISEIYNSMNDEQKDLLHYMVGEALGVSESDDNDSGITHAAEDDPNATIEDVYNSMTDIQKQVLHYMVGEALASVGGEVKQSDIEKGSNTVIHNVFEKTDETGKPVTTTLSHDDLKGIVADATKNGSLKEAVEAYAISHGIQDIDVLFPEAKNVDNTPELFGRRVEWVAQLMDGVKKSPFSRVRTMSADITVAEARAKGYIKGNMKKEEFFRVRSRVTVPQTVYKKQKLDRDDILDITDFDVVAWLKGEMRLMLDEEIARAILVGDGRAVDDEDKILEDHIRPVANDHELYTTVINVNLGDSNSSMQEALDALVLNRSEYRGSGLPTMFTTERYIARILLLRDTTGRKLYKNLEEAAMDLRFKDIIPVEVLEEYPDVLAVIFNPIDYTVGADKGGAVSMFDDFDIDYNQYKYLIETRISGALTKLKSAIVVRVTAADAVEVVPAAPAFDGDAITITNQTGVVYRNAATDAVMNAAGSPYAVADGQTVTVQAEPAAGYFFPTSEDDSWTFTGQA